MTGNGNFSKDPLDLARSQMDFARMAADAPSSKEILFKAQTIIPATPAKPAWQKGAPLAGALLAAGLAFAPVLPENSSLDRLDVSFEESMPLADAQNLQFGIRNALDGDILMGSSFNGTDEAGKLSLSFTAAGEPRLESEVSRVVNEQAADSSPLYGKLINEASLSSRSSIANRVVAMFSSAGSEGEISYIEPQNSSAAELLANPDLIREGLDAVLRHEGYSIASLQFIDRRPQAASEEDYRVLELDAWPRPLHIEMDAAEMTTYENDAVRRNCMDWLDSVNLGTAGHGLTSRPGELLPIMVEVRNSSGLLDRAMTERLQAMIVQPVGGEITDSSTWDVRAAVEEPLASLFGERKTRKRYERVDDPAYNQDVNFFWVLVEMLDEFEDQPKADARTEGLEQQTSF